MGTKAPDAGTPDICPDICIVGGGLTGMMMAVALAHTPYQVCLLDRSNGTTPTADGRTTTINAAGQKMLAALGIWNDLTNAPTPVYAINVASGAAPTGLQARRKSAFDLIWDVRKSTDQSITEPAPMGFVVDNGDLFNALNRTMARQNIIHHTGVTVTGMTVQHGHAIITSDGDNEAAISAITCDLVIACDGANSQLRRGANLRQIKESGLPGHKKQTAIVALIEAERAHDNTAYQRFLPNGPIALMPLDGNMLSLVWTLSEAKAAELLAVDDDEFNNACTAAFGPSLGYLQLAGKRLKWPLAPAVAPQMTRPHLALAGDAAHAIHPLAGQGYNLALGDAAVLVDALSWAHRRGLSAGHSTILVDYEAGRRAEIAAMSSMTSGLNLTLSEKSGGVASLLAMGMAMGMGMGMGALNATALKSVFAKIAGGGVLTKASLLDGNLPNLD